MRQSLLVFALVLIVGVFVITSQEQPDAQGQFAPVFNATGIVTLEPVQAVPDTPLPPIDPTYQTPPPDNGLPPPLNGTLPPTVTPWPTPRVTPTLALPTSQPTFIGRSFLVWVARLLDVSMRIAVQ